MAVASPAARGKLPRQGLKGAALDLGACSSSTSRTGHPVLPLPPSAPSPAARGKGRQTIQFAHAMAIASPAWRGKLPRQGPQGAALDPQKRSAKPAAAPEDAAAGHMRKEEAGR